MEKQSSIEHLLREINRKSPKEAIAFLKDKLSFFDDLQKLNEDKQYAEIVMLLERLQNDKSIAYNRDLNWYYNPDNIPNQEAVFATEKFLKEERKGFFDICYFFNLLFKQKDILKDSVEAPVDYIDSLKKLPISDMQKHLLIGMLLYWHGGYPVNNFDTKLDTILKLIEREFLQQYPGEVTPEKIFSNVVNSKNYKTIKEVSAHLSAAGFRMVDSENLRGERTLFPESQYFKKISINFEELPNYVIQKGIIWKFEKGNYRTDADYIEWQMEYLNLLKTIPPIYMQKTIIKGIEYAEKVYQYHLYNECTAPNECDINQSLERRIALAGAILTEIEKNTHKEFQNETVSIGTKNKEFTTARQVLAVHYLLEYCQVRNVDNTVKARFIQFLTGKQTNAKRIQDTEIYKKVANPLGKTDAELTMDLQYIRNFFEDLNLIEIANAITKEISKREN